MTEYEQEQDAPAVDAAGADGTAWRVFHATGAAPAGAPPAIPPAPPWREFAGQPLQPAPADDDRAERRRLGAEDPGPACGTTRSTPSTPRCCCAARCWSPGRPGWASRPWRI